MNESILLNLVIGFDFRGIPSDQADAFHRHDAVRVRRQRCAGHDLNAVPTVKRQDCVTRGLHRLNREAALPAVVVGPGERDAVHHHPVERRLARARPE